MSEVQSSDLQGRLEYIENRAKELEKVEEVTKEDVRELAYLIGYIAKIVKKHFNSGER
jgi:hypothetical protein